MTTEQVPSKELDVLIRRVNALIPSSVTPATRIEIHPCDWLTLVDAVQSTPEPAAAASNDLLDDAQGLICGIVGWLNMQAIENPNVLALHAGLRQWLVTYADRAANEPGDVIRTRAFWNPDHKELITAYVSADDISLMDDNGDIYEPAGDEQSHGPSPTKGDSQ